MTRRRTGLAATAVGLVLAALPAAAQAHPVDCSGSTSMQAPSGERWIDWGGGSDGCVTVGIRAGGARRQRQRQGRPAARRPAQGSFRQVGHESLRNRGMNAAIAVHGDYAYVGSAHRRRPRRPTAGRADGGRRRPSRRSRPRGGRAVRRQVAGESTRELRVWRSKDLLIVLNTNCGVGPALHHCTVPSISNIRFYDIGGRDAERPRLLHELKVDTHEFFLWVDPKDPDRALIFAGNASSTCGTRGGAPSCPFSVWDISSVPSGGAPATLYSGPYPYTRYPAAPEPVQ